MKASVTNIGSTWPPNTINLPASPPRAELTRSVDKVEDDERLPHVDRIGNATEPVVDLVCHQARDRSGLKRKDEDGSGKHQWRKKRIVGASDQRHVACHCYQHSPFQEPGIPPRFRDGLKNPIRQMSDKEAVQTSEKSKIIARVYAVAGE